MVARSSSLSFPSFFELHSSLEMSYLIGLYSKAWVTVLFCKLFKPWPSYLTEPWPFQALPIHPIGRDVIFSIIFYLDLSHVAISESQVLIHFRSIFFQIVLFFWSELEASAVGPELPECWSNGMSHLLGDVSFYFYGL